MGGALVLLLSLWGSAAQAQAEEHDFGRIYACLGKLQKVSGIAAVFLADDFFYLEGRDLEITLFTPHFAGKVSFAVDAAGKPIEVPDPDPNRTANTISTSGASSTYRVRLPYSPKKGAFYLDIGDTYTAIYADMKYVHGKTVITRFDPPHIWGGHNSRVVSSKFSAEVLPGYHELAAGEHFWSWRPGNFSADAKAAFLAAMKERLANLPPELKPGAPSQCWGHAGCDYRITLDEAEASHAAREDVLQVCHAVDKELGLGLFSSP